MRRYTVLGSNMTLGTGVVLLAFRTAADAVTAGGLIQINRIEIGQNGTETSDMIRGELVTRDTAGTLTMTSVTPQAIAPLGGPISALVGNTAPAGAAVRIGINSSADSGGTYTVRRAFDFNNLNGYLWIGTPEDRLWVPPATVFGVRFAASPTSATGWTISLDYEELV